MAKAVPAKANLINTIYLLCSFVYPLFNPSGDFFRHNVNPEIETLHVQTLGQVQLSLHPIIFSYDQSIKLLTCDLLWG